MSLPQSVQITQAQGLLEKCRGQQLVVPYLYKLAEGWDPRLNPNYDDSVAERVDEWRRR
jgi:hypothetical protein